MNSPQRGTGQVWHLTPSSLLKLIAEIKPDLLAKGGDYDMVQLAETAVVKAHGGKALTIPFVAGYSTTALVTKIKTGA